MATSVTCPHKKVKFVGYQETLDGMPDLILYNCTHCQSTVARWSKNPSVSIAT